MWIFESPGFSPIRKKASVHDNVSRIRRILELSQLKTAQGPIPRIGGDNGSTIVIDDDHVTGARQTVPVPIRGCVKVAFLSNPSEESLGMRLQAQKSQRNDRE